MLERAYDALCVMGTALSHHGFFVADRYSIADIALQGYTHVVEGGFDLKAYPAVLVWLDRIRSQLKHIAITQS
jgi:glutathione S-transferase